MWFDPCDKKSDVAETPIYRTRPTWNIRTVQEIKGTQKNSGTKQILADIRD